MADLLIDAFTDDRFGPVDRQELRLAPRPDHGWDLSLPAHTIHGIEYLRRLAVSYAYVGLWPSDIHDVATTFDGHRTTRVCGVDVTPRNEPR